MAGFVNELFDESGKPIERYLPAIKDIQDGRKVVTTAGTAVALAASTRCFYVFITALSTNTNRVMIGGSTVVAAVGATSRGTPLSANEKIGFPIDDLSKVYVDSVTNGEGVMFTYYSLIKGDEPCQSMSTAAPAGTASSKEKPLPKEGRPSVRAASKKPPK